MLRSRESFINKIFQSDARELAEFLPRGFVHCIVTSIPYYRHRNYGVEPLVFGGDKSCAHRWGQVDILPPKSGGLNGSGLEEAKPNLHQRPSFESRYCEDCGAWLGQYGGEPSVSQYIKNTVEVFAALKKLLREDGVCWLNVGDSYSPKNEPNGIKAKDLCLIPARVAIALQEDGWFVRSSLPWIKRNAMPGPEKDRPTGGGSSIEYFLMLTKGEPFFDLEAIKLKADESLQRSFRNSDLFVQSLENGKPRGLIAGGTDSLQGLLAIDVNTFPNLSKHTAPFNHNLIAPLIKMSTSEKGCCGECGAQWTRKVKRENVKRHLLPKSDKRYRPKEYSGTYSEKKGKTHFGFSKTKTVGWEKPCNCKRAEIVPAIVCDPFMGSGTTAWVAERLGLEYVGGELSKDNLSICKDRLVNKQNELF